MKPIRFSTVLAKSKTLRRALITPAMVFTMSSANAGTTAPTAPAEPAVPANWITFTIGGSFVSGDDAGYMRRTGINDNFYGGIEDMKFTHALNDSTTLTLDGHAMPGLEDYEFNLNLEKTDLGYVKAGFKQFRTWYDASGGYLQGANMTGIATQFDDEQSIDRGEIYFEAGLRKEHLPEITFSYRHLYRDGQKDSTCWGDSPTNANWGGVANWPGPSPAASSYGIGFKMMPALWDIDEKTDIFELDIEHTLGNTDLGAGLVYESYSIDNTRYTPRWGSVPTGVGSGSVTGVSQVYLREQTDADIFAGNIHSVTRFNDKAWLSFAASYSSMDTDIDGGSRSYGIYWPTPIPGSPTRRDYAYDQMSGGSNVDQFITNLNFMWVPVQDLTVTPSLRYEHESMDTISNFRAFNTNQSWQGLESLGSYVDMDSFTEAIDIRYTGLDNIVLYAKGEWEQEQEDIRRLDRYLPDGSGVADADAFGEFLNTDVEIDEQQYTIGANWYALSNLSFSIQGFHEERNQSLDHLEGNETPLSNPGTGGANNFRPIMTEHNSEIDDFNVRMTWRPMSNLSLVTRYDYAHTEYENAGIAWTAPAAPTFYPIIESGDIVSHILSQSVTWSPMASLYVQGTLSWISSETDTPEQYTGDADNDSIFATLSAGYAIDDRTELTASYTYYQANNYVNSKSFNGVDTMGYGLETEEQMIALTLTRVINPSMVWNLRYAFVTSNTVETDQSGGFNDFDAHMISTGLQIRF